MKDIARKLKNGRSQGPENPKSPKDLNEMKILVLLRYFAETLSFGNSTVMQPRDETCFINEI